MDLPPPDPGIEISLASRGYSKGLAQTDVPQLLVRGELVFGPVYLAAIAKNVTSPLFDGETFAIVGLRKKVGGFNLAGSAAWRRMIAPVGTVDANALELNATVSRAIGRLTPQISVTWSPDDLGSTRRSTYTEAGAGYRLAKGLTLSAAVSRRERRAGLDYTAYNAGLGYALDKRLTLGLRYYDTNRGGDPIYKQRLVLSALAKL
jgi:hypothetical protein